MDSLNACSLLIFSVAITPFISEPFASAASVRCDHCDRGYTDGCSIPFNLDIAFKEEFKPACHKHDVCYKCGSVNGASRHNCDETFGRNIRQICYRMNFSSWPRCLLASIYYYASVKTFGKAEYLERPPLWCGEDWVQYCLPK